MYSVGLNVIISCSYFPNDNDVLSVLYWWQPCLSSPSSPGCGRRWCIWTAMCRGQWRWPLCWSRTRGFAKVLSDQVRRRSGHLQYMRNPHYAVNMQGQQKMHDSLPNSILPLLLCEGLGSSKGRGSGWKQLNRATGRCPATVLQASHSRASHQMPASPKRWQQDGRRWSVWSFPTQVTVRTIFVHTYECWNTELCVRGGATLWKWTRGRLLKSALGSLRHWVYFRSHEPLAMLQLLSTYKIESSR